jgi:hypothetical protein
VDFGPKDDTERQSTVRKRRETTDKRTRQTKELEREESECPADKIDTERLTFTADIGAGMSHFAVSFKLDPGHKGEKVAKVPEKA